MAYNADAFGAAGQPGRGSKVGDFVPGKNGGWVPADHPDAASDTLTPSASASAPPVPVTGGPDYVAEGPAGVGSNPGEAGPMGPAMAGLQSASGMGGSASSGVQSLAPPGASNPALGQRIYPTAMRQLAMLAPRIY